MTNALTTLPGEYEPRPRRALPDREPPPRRSPPMNLEAEQALLGAILANNRAYERVCDFLRAGHFADPVNGDIYRAIAGEVEAGRQANPVTLKARFDQDERLGEVGGARYLLSLATSVVTVINAADYGRQIRDTFIRREMIEIGETLVNEAFDANTADSTAGIEAVLSALDALTEGGQAGAGGPVSAADGVASAVRAIEEAFRRGGRMVGIATGYAAVDAIMGGLAAGNVIYVGGRPSMGKSAFVRDIAWRHARAGNATAVFSPEMTCDEQHQAILAKETGIAVTDLRRGRLDRGQWERIMAARERIAAVPLTIDDRRGITPGRIRSTLRRMRGDAAPSLVVVDYLQMMRPDRERATKVNEIGEISRALKEIAGEFNVPVIVLSQLSRAVESRDDKRPLLSDLRESGDIEQDADIVAFVYREEYYLQRAQPEQKAGEDLGAFGERRGKWLAQMERARGRADIIIAKNRLGPVGTARLRFDGPSVTFSSAGDAGDAPDAGDLPETAAMEF